MRFVFEVSAESTSDESLNDILMVGPHTQQEHLPILLRFITLPVVVCADIEKKFRQVFINPMDRNFMRIIWRKSSQDSIQHYRLTTVTCGTAFSPCQSTRALHELAFDEKIEFPFSSAAVLKDFYVNELLSGGSE